MTKMPRNQNDDQIEGLLAEHPYPLKNALQNLGKAANEATPDERKQVILQVGILSESERLPAEVRRHLELSVKVMRAAKSCADFEKVQRHQRGHGMPSGDPSDPRFDEGDPK